MGRLISTEEIGMITNLRNWNDYKLGFGKLIGELWFGNENIHDLTKPANAPKKSELLINMLMKGQTKKVYARYSTFQIGDEKNQYTLSVNGFSGNVSVNQMGYHNGKKFSTSDKDTSTGCASQFKSGWWYENCFKINLNGPYQFSSVRGICWDSNKNLQPKFVEMKVRRKL